MQEPIVIHAHDHYVIGTLFARKHQVLLTSGMDKRIKLWSVPEWQLLKTIEGHQNSVNSLSLDPDENFLASGSTDASIRVWSFPNGALQHTLLDRKQTVSQVKYSTSGALLGGVYYGGYLAIWNQQGESILRLKISKKNLSSLVFHPSENYVAISGLGDEISTWSIPDGQQLHKFPAHPVAVSSLRFIQAGKALVSMGYDQTIKFWDAETWQLEKVLAFKEKTLRCLTFTSDERFMAIGFQGAIQLWSLTPLSLLDEFSAGTNALNQLSFSPDNRWLAAGAADQKLHIWPLDLAPML